MKPLSLSIVLLVFVLAGLEAMSVTDLLGDLLQQNLQIREQLLQLQSQAGFQGDKTFSNILRVHLN